MGKLIKEKNNHLNKKKKTKRKNMMHTVKCPKCGSTSEYTSRDRDKDNWIRCLNEKCRYKLRTAWGDDDEEVVME